MKNKLFKILLLFVATLATQSVLAWGGQGHSAIAYYAERLLSPEAKAKAQHYLRSTITYQASWMDQYRSIEGYTDCDMWHSTNIDTKGKVVVGLNNNRQFQKEIKVYLFLLLLEVEKPLS